MIVIGKGNTAEVIEYQEGKVCKLFFEGYPLEYVELEYENAKEMYRNGIKIPEPFKIVNISNRNGIIYEKIEGETLLNCLSENRKSINDGLDLMVRLQIEVSKHHSHNVPSCKEYLKAMLKNKKVKDQTVLEAIEELEEDDCLLHGDFHPGNIMIMSDGLPTIIDFMNVCHGPFLYDIARTYFILHEFDDEMAEKYLEKMHAYKKDIQKYLMIIEICRRYERSK